MTDRQQAPSSITPEMAQAMKPLLDAEFRRLTMLVGQHAAVEREYQAQADAARKAYQETAGALDEVARLQQMVLGQQSQQATEKPPLSGNETEDQEQPCQD